VTRRIHVTPSTQQPLRVKASSLPRIEASQVAAALGAEPVAERLEEALAPITLFAVREELRKRLHSSGGRPALSGVTRRAKIPLSDQEWLQLEELAAAVSSADFAPSAGQVASVLLTLSMRSVASQVSRSSSDSPLARELAALAAAESDEGRTDSRK
jgi:hypothetical protein